MTWERILLFTFHPRRYAFDRTHMGFELFTELTRNITNISWKLLHLFKLAATESTETNRVYAFDQVPEIHTFFFLFYNKLILFSITLGF
jgi:hypothetical protein